MSGRRVQWRCVSRGPARLYQLLQERVPQGFERPHVINEIHYEKAALVYKVVLPSQWIMTRQ